MLVHPDVAGQFAGQPGVGGAPRGAWSQVRSSSFGRSYMSSRVKGIIHPDTSLAGDVALSTSCWPLAGKSGQWVATDTNGSSRPRSISKPD